MIDIHAHIGRIVWERPELRPATLLRRMDRLGIEKAVVLAVENPEEVHWYVPTERVLEVCRRHPDRLIPFCCTDPRHGVWGNFPIREVLRTYVEQGCRGFGEYLAGLPVNHPLSMRIYEVCAELELPVLMHIDSYINADRVGFPGLREVLGAFPELPFIVHGPGWWVQISADVRQEEAYPSDGPSPYIKGPVVPGGPIEQVLADHPNLYADISAPSGYNALTRDPAYGKRLLERFSNQIVFGTDYLYPRQPLPIVRWLREIGLQEEIYRKIARGNAERLLKLAAPEEA